MLDSLILPPWLLFLCIVLIILPTIACIFLRRTLYRDIMNSAEKVTRLLNKESPGRQPQIVNKLKGRFEEASKNLEQVNTGALIDGIYSEETFSFLSFTLTCEQWDAFCRFLPNLLISFGLLGTFFGITINLSSISGIINQNNGNLENLLTQLQQPLQGMGIAFITSLIAIACSATLTLVNLRWNTSLAKEKLISSLEDYLDNIVHPTIEGHTRLDKAVNRMVEKQNEFLTRFHTNVREVLESTLTPAADRIAEQNEKSHQLAEKVYQEMKKSSTTLSQGTDMLQNSATIFQAASETIQKSKFPDRLLEATTALDSTQRQFSQSVSNLQNTTESMGKAIGGAIASLQNSTTDMVQLAQQQVESLNQQSAQIKELSDNNQQSLDNITTQLRRGADNIAALESAQKQFNEDNHQSLDNITTQLRIGAQNTATFQKAVGELNQNNQESLTHITTQLQQGADNIAALGVSIKQLHDNNRQSLTEIATQLRIGAQNTAAFQKAVGELNQNNQESLTHITTQLRQGADNVAALEVSLERFYDNNRQSLTDIITQLQRGADNVAALGGAQKQFNDNITTQLQERNRSQVETIVQQLQYCTSNLQANQSELAKLIQILQQNRDGSENQDNSNSPKEDPDIRRIRDFVDL